MLSALYVQDREISDNCQSRSVVVKVGERPVGTPRATKPTSDPDVCRLASLQGAGCILADEEGVASGAVAADQDVALPPCHFAEGAQGCSVVQVGVVSRAIVEAFVVRDSHGVVGPEDAVVLDDHDRRSGGVEGVKKPVVISVDVDRQESSSPPNPDSSTSSLMLALVTNVESAVMSCRHPIGFRCRSRTCDCPASTINPRQSSC